MSKKTNAEKQARRMKPRRMKPRKSRGHPNPIPIEWMGLASGESLPAIQGGPKAFSDPIFMHHFAGAIMRLLELYPVSGKDQTFGDYLKTIEPKGVQ